MAMGNALALQVQTPDINTVGNFQASQANAQNMAAQKQDIANSQLEAKKRGMQGLYVLSAGVLRDGVVNPDEWEEAMDLAEQSGTDPEFIKRLRGKPQLAQVLARSSAEALKFGHDERMMDLEYEKLANEIAKAGEESGNQEKVDAILRKHAPDIADAYSSGMLDGPKAYEALEKRLNGNQDDAPEGYRYTDAGDMEAVPGGPQDPENPLNKKKVADRSLTTAETKELFDAQDAITAGEAAVPMLEKMLTLNQTAWDGPLADAGTSVGAMFGDKNSADTQELKNLTTAQALEQLKAVFGGMPTEGERKILLEIQGAVGQARDVRKRIFDRALEAAKRRIESNRAKAEGIKTGDYKMPDSGAAAPSGGSGDPDLKSKYGLE